MKTPLQSNTIVVLFFTIAGTALAEIGRMLATHHIDWWAFGAAVVPQISGIFFRLAMPDVQAPAVLNGLFGGLLNRSNLPVPKP